MENRPTVAKFHNLFHLGQKDAKSVISTGQYAGLNLTPLDEVYIFKKMKRPFTNSQNSEPGIDCIVAYEVVKLASFFIVYSGGSATVYAYFELFYFSQKRKRDRIFKYDFWKNFTKGVQFGKIKYIFTVKRY